MTGASQIEGRRAVLLSISKTLQLFLIAMLLSGFLGIIIEVDDIEPATPPESLCGLVRPEMVNRLVPNAARPYKEEKSNSTAESSKTCTIESREGGPGNARASLSFTLTRFGSYLRRDTPIGNAREEFERIRVDFRPISSVGDEAAVGIEILDPGDSSVQAEIYVQSAADVLTVSYTAEPVDADLARDATVAVAREVLSKL